ncbi:MAG: PD40 domain-containing protein, partial [Chloroflexi bacterium]|nr:PD40 domain-containing protein [Chloroflexota bacterium]
MFRLVQWSLPLITALALLLGCGGCARSAPVGALVLTQAPISPAGTSGATDILDVRYPFGSRVVLAVPPFHSDHVQVLSKGLISTGAQESILRPRAGNIRVLSKGLVAAGSPIVSPDGRRVFFAGKADAAATWQIYEARTGGGTPKQITDIPGGAMDPALIATGDLVFSSPVPKPGENLKPARPSALYAQSPGGLPRRLTFGSAGAVEPTVLADGRILFVSAQPAAAKGAEPRLALFTVNNDGTEVTAFAGQHDGAASIHRPRELGRGRVGFLASNPDSATNQIWAESVRAARPFASRERLFPFQAGQCRSVEPGEEDALLASFETRGVMGRSMRGSQAIFQVAPEAQVLGQPLFDDPGWDDIEAARMAPRPKPTGHISTMVAAKKTGTILCLDANRTSYRAADGG